MGFLRALSGVVERFLLDMWALGWVCTKPRLPGKIELGFAWVAKYGSGWACNGGSNWESGSDGISSSLDS